jgi:hypothetical protein
MDPSRRGRAGVELKTSEATIRLAAAEAKGRELIKVSRTTPDMKETYKERDPTVSGNRGCC